MKPTGLFFAVRDEARVIIDNKIFDWCRVEDDFYESRSFPLSLVVSGVGKAFASYYLSKITGISEKILIMGTSAGLSDNKIGTVYISDEFVEHDMDLTGLGFEMGVTPFCGMKSNVIKNSSDEYLNEIIGAAKNAGIEPMRGLVISGDLFLHDQKTALEKKNLFNASLADMESAAVAKICWKIGREVIALRYITDNANHDSAADWRENVKKSAVLFNAILEQMIIA